MLKNLDDGVSPVIGVILIIALVVALVALVSVSVFNITDDNNADDSSAGSAIDFTATTDGVEVSVIRQGSADEFIVKVDGQELERLNGTGDSALISAEGVYSIVGVYGDSEEVVVTKRVTGSITGLFTVFQDQGDGTVEAQLVERYNDTDEYELVVSSDNDTDTSTTSFDLEEDDGRLLSSGESQLLQSIPSSVPSNAASIVNMTTQERAEELGNTAPPITVGDKAQVHDMLGSWCKGDDLLLVDAEDGSTVLDGDEFEFDNNCGGLRTVPKYTDGEITGAKVINLWSQEIDYSMYSFKGQIEPPKRGLANSGSYDVKVEVYQQDGSGNIDTSSPIENADVTIGNKAGPTDANGEITITDVPNGNDYFVTVNADEYDGTQSTFVIEKDGSDNFQYMNFTGVSTNNGEPQNEKIDDDGIYNVTDTATDKQKTLRIGLNQFNPEVKVIESKTVSSGSTQIVNFDNTGSSDGTVIGLSGGSTGYSSGGGGFSSTSSSGSVSSGSSVYSGGGFSSTQTFSASTKTVAEDEQYTPAAPNNNLDATESSQTIDLPSRDFQVGQIDESEIPQDESISIDVDARTYSEQEVTDTIQVYQSNITSGSSDTELNPIKQVDITLPPGSGGDPGNTVTETIQFDLTATNTTSNPGVWESGKEYNTYVALKSVGEPKEAGTLDVFNSELQSAGLTLDQSSVTLKNTDRSIDNGLVGDTVSVKLESATDSPSGETVDIYKNGELVRRVQNYDGTQDPIYYNETINDPKFIDYHIGVKESANTSLLNTAIISELAEGSDSTAFDGYTVNPEISVEDTSKCDTLDSVSSSYDCNVELGTATNINFKAGGVYQNSSGDDIGNSSDVQIDLNVGTAASFTDIGNSTTKTFDLSSASDTAYLVELTATISDGAGNEITRRDTYILNMYTSTDEVTTRVTGVTTSGDDQFTVQLQSDRASIDENVNLQFRSNTTGQPANGTYVVSDKRIRPDITEEVTVTVPEIAYNDSGGSGDIYTGSGTTEDTAVAALTSPDGSVPFTVNVQDGDSDTNVSGTNETFTINPSGEIVADINGDVRVNECPDGTSPVTVSSADAGTCDVSFLSEDDSDGNFTIRLGKFGYENPDTYKIIDPSGSELSDSFQDGDGQGTDIQVSSPASSGVYEVRHNDSNGNVQVVASLDMDTVSP